jgi:hypothetical protein
MHLDNFRELPKIGGILSDLVAQQMLLLSLGQSLLRASGHIISQRD